MSFGGIQQVLITQLFKTAGANLVVFKDGTTYKCVDDAGNLVAASTTNPATVIQAGIDSITSGKILVKNGTYSIPKGSQITLKSGIELIGENEGGTILEWAATAISDAGYNNIVNANVAAGDRAIKVANMTLKFGTPSMDAGSFVNGFGYNGGIYFQGVYDSRLENLTMEHAGFRFDPFSGASAAQKQDLAGKNYGNIVSKCTIKDGVASSALFSAHTTKISDCRFLNYADDSLLIAQSGFGIVVENCYFDGQQSWPYGGAGGKTAEIFILNDGGVDGTTCDVMNVVVQGCWIRNPPPSTTTLGACIAASKANVKIYNTICEGAVGFTSAFTSTGGNIVIRNCNLIMEDVVSRLAKDNGMYIIYDTAIPTRRSSIKRCKFYDNALDAGTTQDSGLVIESSQSAPILDVEECEFYDDQGSPTQANGLKMLSTNNARNVNLVRCKFGTGITTKISIVGSIVNQFGVVKYNEGVNPIGIKNTLGAPAITGSPFIIGVSSGHSPAALAASQAYTVYACDCYVTSSGGTGVSITIKDDAGNTIISGLATLNNFMLRPGWTIDFGAFSVAPTVTVWCD